MPPKFYTFLIRYSLKKIGLSPSPNRLLIIYPTNRTLSENEKVANCIINNNLADGIGFLHG